jgi:hypothetical protein
MTEVKKEAGVHNYDNIYCCLTQHDGVQSGCAGVGNLLGAAGWVPWERQMIG